MTHKLDRAKQVLERVASVRLLVVGDMVVDEHIVGATTRLSREAPVPVIEQTGHLFVPGGAANPAYNARALGAEVSVCGLVGDDEMGARLRQILDGAGIHTAFLATEPNRATPVKLRIWAGGDRQRQHQQVARVDIVNREPVSESSQGELMLYLEGAVPEYDGIVISDYENGVVAGPVLDFLLPLARARSKFIMADSHGRLRRFRGVSAMTPNQPEAEAELGKSLDDESGLIAGGEELRTELDCDNLLITLGSLGIALFSRGEEASVIPAHKVTGVADTTGAGDTVAATFALSILAGATPREAAELANAAGAAVVMKLGAATTTASEIVAILEEHVE